MAAEALSPTFGAISLANLFQTCMECYDYIEREKTYLIDLAKLTTRLEVEKIRLLMWGESVDMVRNSERLSGVFDRPQVWQTHNVLNCVYIVSLQPIS